MASLAPARAEVEAGVVAKAEQNLVLSIYKFLLREIHETRGNSR